MSTNMSKLADHILALAAAKPYKISVTNLQLQKVMYFTLKFAGDYGYDRETLNDIYDEPFLVWRYGPVIQSIYERFKNFGSTSILGDFTKNERFNGLDTLILRLLQIDPFILVELSHENCFWKNNEDKIEYGQSNIEYSIDEVLSGEC